MFRKSETKLSEVWATTLPSGGPLPDTSSLTVELLALILREKDYGTSTSFTSL
jgi:hypothetical protein